MPELSKDPDVQNQLEQDESASEAELHEEIQQAEAVEDHVTEKQALDRAAEEGIKFEDFYTIEGEQDEYPTYEAAAKDANGRNIIQNRRQKAGSAQDFQDAAKAGKLDMTSSTDK